MDIYQPSIKEWPIILLQYLHLSRTSKRSGPYFSFSFGEQAREFFFAPNRVISHDSEKVITEYQHKLQINILTGFEFSMNLCYKMKFILSLAHSFAGVQLLDPFYNTDCHNVWRNKFSQNVIESISLDVCCVLFMWRYIKHI